MELEYEGELKGGDAVARELIRVAVGKVYDQLFRRRQRVADRAVVRSGRHAEAGREPGFGDHGAAARIGIQGLMEKTKALGLAANEPDAVRASAAEFVLEGLYAHRRISRNEERGFAAEENASARPREEGPRSSGRTSGGNITRRWRAGAGLSAGK